MSIDPDGRPGCGRSLDTGPGWSPVRVCPIGPVPFHPPAVKKGYVKQMAESGVKIRGGDRRRLCGCGIRGFSTDSLFSGPVS